MLGEEALDRRQPVAHAERVAEEVMAVLAEGRLQHVLGIGAAGVEALVPAARHLRAEEEVVLGIVEEDRHANRLAE